MNNPDHLSSRDLDRLSAYLDGECSNKEAAKLEARLRVEPGLRQALEELRATAGLLRALSEVSIPRSFALSPEMVGIKQRRSYPIIRLATALASLAFVTLVGLDALTSSIAPLVGSLAPAADMRELSVQEGEALEAPMMAAAPGALPTEDDVTGEDQQGVFGDEQDAPDMLQMTAEAAERSESIVGEAEAPLESTPKCNEKASETPLPSAGVEGLAPTESATQVAIEPADLAPERTPALLELPTWRIGLRAGEIFFGLAALVLASFMIWTRRK